jgi:Putative DNA-binding domain
MPTLLELQTAMRRGMVRGDKAEISAMLAGGVSPDRLDIYRNTFVFTLTRALRLCFPAVEKLVGAEFFAATTHAFVVEHPPRAAWLDQYGEALPDFLHDFPPAKSLSYLSDVARLEWAVNRALHAADTEPLDPARLARVATEDRGYIRLIAEPSIALLHLRHPADAIWRAVLAGSDRELGAIDLASGPVHLLVERRREGVSVARLPADRWHLLAALCAGQPIETAIDHGCGFDIAAALADHLSSGRFIDFELAPGISE